MKFNRGKREPSEMEKLLGTGKPEEQAMRVQALLRPVLTMVIQFDLRTGQVGLTNVGAEIPAPLAHRMLDMARTVVARMEGESARAAQDKTVVESQSPAVEKVEKQTEETLQG